MTREDAERKIRSVFTIYFQFAGDREADEVIEALRQEPCEYEELDFVQPHKKIPVNLVPCKEENRWIPVSERLPEENKKVIVSDVFGVYIGRFIDAEETWGGKHFVNEHGTHSKSVTAWMPLPKPYKAESEVQDADCN